MTEDKKRILWYSAVNAVATFAYVAAVAWTLTNAGRIFEGSTTPSFLIPLGMLMLFVASAAITGSLVLGRPAYLYFEGKKKDAIWTLIYTIGWLLLLTIAAFVAYIAINR